LLTEPHPASNHNGGHVAFSPDDGFLYAAFGDGGSSGDPQDNAQNTTNLLGSIVRLDIDSAAPDYNIPPGNPFAANQLQPCVQGAGAGNCPEIFAWGLRNPWRFSFDSATGDLWAGDVGQGAIEEVDVVVVGEDYGWNVKEGSACYPPSVADCPTDAVDPVAEYGRDLGASITGGYVYRGAAVPDLVGWYVFGDFVSGRIFAVEGDMVVPMPPTSPVEPEVIDESGLSISTFAQDSDGELYVIDYSNGDIFQITAP